MNTLFSPTDNSQQAMDATDVTLMCVQRACLIMLGTLMALPAYSQVVPRKEPIGGIPSQGDGFIAPAPPAPPRAATPTPPPAPPPPLPPPPPPVEKPKTPQGEPGQGSGPTKTPIQGAGPATGTTNSTYSALPPAPPRIALPGGATQGDGPSAARTVNSATPPTPAVGGGAPFLASTSAPVGTPPQGTQPQEVFSGGGGAPNTLQAASLPTNTNGAGGYKLPPKQSPFQGAGNPRGSAVDGRLIGGIGEILPGEQKLSESMQPLPSKSQDGDTNAVAVNTKVKCTPVSLRPDSQRPSMSLVDMTGDGLIVAAVAHEHIQAVFTRAGYARLDLSQAARWCVSPSAARELLQPGRGNSVQQAALLVQTSGGMQLMSQDQWVAHQASLRPLVAAMAPAKSAKPSKLAKTNSRLIAKPNVKSAGVTVGALRLPAGASKAGANS